jgi:hypothetical protein
LISIGCFERTENGDITGLKLMGCMRGKIDWDNTVRHAVLQEFKGLMGAKAIAY